MQFAFKWPEQRDEAAREHYRQLAQKLLNKFNDPPSIIGPFHVVQFDMGDAPPQIVLNEVLVAEPTIFRGIFRVSFGGSFIFEVQSSVELNLASCPDDDDGIYWHLPTVSAHTQFRLPIAVSLSDLNIDGRLLVTWTKDGGVKATFLDDPLKKITFASSFSYLKSLHQLLQDAVENGLRQMLTSVVPNLVQRSETENLPVLQMQEATLRGENEVLPEDIQDRQKEEPDRIE